MYVPGDKKCSFFRKFGVLCFLETPVLRFALLPYYRRTNNESSPSKGANKKKENIWQHHSKVIDNKRAHLEKKSSASQRDSILMTEAREDVALRREIIHSINNSNEIFSNAVTGITDSFKMLNETMT